MMMKKLLDDERIRIAILAFAAGVILAFIIYPKPEAEEIYKFTTKTEIDTAFVKHPSLLSTERQLCLAKC